MLINSLRFYERILLGLQDPDEEVRDNALGCLSFLIVNIKHQQIVLPPVVEKMLSHLPEGRL